MLTTQQKISASLQNARQQAGLSLRQRAVDAMPDGVKVTKKDLQFFRREGQVRLWWDRTPVDVFPNSTQFHEQLVNRVRWEWFAGQGLRSAPCHGPEKPLSPSVSAEQQVQLQVLIASGSSPIYPSRALLPLC